MVDGTEKPQGIFISGKLLTFILSILAILGTVVTVVTAANSIEYRIGTLETRDINSIAVNKELVSEITKLKDKIVILTITMNRIENKQETFQERSK